MNRDPRSVLANSPMGGFQIAAVTLCILLYAMDGFDVLSISFAAPGIATEWGMDRAALGLVLSMELIGMAIGSVVIGGLADRTGRRPMILGCLVVMSAGMLAAATAGSVQMLSLYRFITGLGIGGMLASANAMAAEYSNARSRNLSVVLMAAGYPVGVIAGGSISSLLLASYDWRAVFVFGAAATAAFLPLVWWLLPESIEYLAQKRPPNALERINATLRRMGHEAVPALPALPAASPGAKRTGAGLARLFSPELARTTVLLTVAYCAHIMTFYFILKWIPKIVVDLGFAASAAGGVLVWANVGGATGSILLGLLTKRFGVRGLVVGALICSAIMVVVFGQPQSELRPLVIVSAVAGFCTNSAVVGLFAMFAQSFPTEVRAGGTGLVIGVGRAGAALGPIIAGYLFTAGFTLASVALAMALGSLIAAVAIALVRYREAGP